MVGLFLFMVGIVVVFVSFVPVRLHSIDRGLSLMPAQYIIDCYLPNAASALAVRLLIHFLDPSFDLPPRQPLSLEPSQPPGFPSSLDKCSKP